MTKQEIIDKWEKEIVPIHDHLNKTLTANPRRFLNGMKFAISLMLDDLKKLNESIGSEESKCVTPGCNNSDNGKTYLCNECQTKFRNN